MSKAEKKVENYYKKQGYEVKNIEPNNHYRFEDDCVRDKLSSGILSKGVPDLFVYRKESHKAKRQRYESKEPKEKEYIDENFFVEVKTENGALSYSQFKWVDNHPEEECLVAFVKGKEVETFPFSTKNSIKPFNQDRILSV